MDEEKSKKKHKRSKSRDHKKDKEKREKIKSPKTKKSRSRSSANSDQKKSKKEKKEKRSKKDDKKKSKSRSKSKEKRKEKRNSSSKDRKNKKKSHRRSRSKSKSRKQQRVSSKSSSRSQSSIDYKKKENKDKEIKPKKKEITDLLVEEYEQDKIRKLQQRQAKLKAMKFDTEDKTAGQEGLTKTQLKGEQAAKEERERSQKLLANAGLIPSQPKVENNVANGNSGLTKNANIEKISKDLLKSSMIKDEEEVLFKKNIQDDNKQINKDLVNKQQSGGDILKNDQLEKEADKDEEIEEEIQEKIIDEHQKESQWFDEQDDDNLQNSEQTVQNNDILNKQKYKNQQNLMAILSKTSTMPQNQSKIQEIKQEKKEEIEEEEDELDKFMNGLKDHAVEQEAFDFKLLEKNFPQEGENQNDQNFDEEQEYDQTKVITFEDLYYQQQNQNVDQNNTNLNELVEQIDIEKNSMPQLVETIKTEVIQQIIDEDDQYYEQFQEFLKQQKQKELEEIQRKEEEKQKKLELEQKQKEEYKQQQEQQQDQQKSKKFQQERMKYQDEMEDDFLGPKNPLDDDQDQDGYFAKKKKEEARRDLKVVDHSKVEYEAIKKNFYIEVKEITEMTKEQVDQYRKDLSDIKVRGKDCPRPIQNWYQCGLSDKILRILIEKRQYLKPNPIQNQAIPAIMSGRDVIGIAETGSGKTLAYVLPMLRHILYQTPLQEGDGPISLILAPTRELVLQIYYEVQTFAKALSLNVVCVYGGTGLAGQLSDLKRGAEIVVCTPGRMIEVLTTSNGKITNLRRVTYMVLDEADRMFDMGFESQITKIISNIRPDRQTVMFSATFPKNIEGLAKKILVQPIEIVVGNRGQACQNVEQLVEVREESSKFLRLLEILGEWNDQGSILIFVDKQSEADDLFKELLKSGYLAFVLHGGQDQEDRQYTINDFKKGIRNILVATSLCARGLDIKQIVLVVNYKCPNHFEDYIHRIGRTGRAGNKGTAITFITPDEEQFAYDLVKALKINNSKINPVLLEMVQNFKDKVDKGEAKIYTNKNRDGKGYNFTEDEKSKITERKEVEKKQFGYDYNLEDEDLSDDEIINKKNAQPEKPVILTEEDRKKLEEKRKRELEDLMKNPEIKAQATAAAAKAAKDAIFLNLSQDQILAAAQNAIKQVLIQTCPSVQSVEKGLEKVVGLIDEFEHHQSLTSDVLSAELEINDYPENARKKVTNKEFLGMIHDLTNCEVSIRGTFIEAGKKVPLGQKKLHIFIQGEAKHNVGNAYREIKRELEEHAMKALTQQAYSGRYKI